MSAYSVHGVEKIMTEIMTNGPVEGAFTVYADFPQYKSGKTLLIHESFGWLYIHIIIPFFSFCLSWWSDIVEIIKLLISSSIKTRIWSMKSIQWDVTVFCSGLIVGVYKHTTGQPLGGHAIKIMGWGTEQGEDYWLVANSWNPDWGDQGKQAAACPKFQCYWI